MEALNHKCPSCGAKITFHPKEQKWVCEYCGSQFTLEEMQKYQNASSEDVNQKTVQKDVKVEEADVYRCKSCGAEIVADANTTATFCVYCGNTAILKERIQNSRVPDLIIPFQKVKNDAVGAFEKVVKHKPLVPKLFKRKENINKITGIYIPFWAYDFEVAGDVEFNATDIKSWSDMNYQYTKTDTFLTKCQGKMSYDKVLADGSSRFPDDLMDSLEPFQYKDLVTYNHAFLSGFLAEKYDVDDTVAIDRAKSRTINTSVSLLQERVRHQTSNVAKNDLSIQKSDCSYIMLPVFMVNIKYRDKMYTFAMNGQTGKIVGDLPLGRKEVILWSVGIFLLCLAVMVLLFIGGVI